MEWDNNLSNLEHLRDKYEFNKKVITLANDEDKEMDTPEEEPTSELQAYLTAKGLDAYTVARYFAIDTHLFKKACRGEVEVSEATMKRIKEKYGEVEESNGIYIKLDYKEKLPVDTENITMAYKEDLAKATGIPTEYLVENYLNNIENQRLYEDGTHHMDVYITPPPPPQKVKINVTLSEEKPLIQFNGLFVQPFEFEGLTNKSTNEEILEYFRNLTDKVTLNSTTYPISAKCVVKCSYTSPSHITIWTKPIEEELDKG